MRDRTESHYQHTRWTSRQPARHPRPSTRRALRCRSNYRKNWTKNRGPVTDYRIDLPPHKQSWIWEFKATSVSGSQARAGRRKIDQQYVPAVLATHAGWNVDHGFSFPFISAGERRGYMLSVWSDQSSADVEGIERYTYRNLYPKGRRVPADEVEAFLRAVLAIAAAKAVIGAIGDNGGTAPSPSPAPVPVPSHHKPVPPASPKLCWTPEGPRICVG